MCLDVFFPFLCLLIHREGNNLKSFLMIAIVHLFDQRNMGEAVRICGCPEIKQGILVFLDNIRQSQVVIITFLEFYIREHTAHLPCLAGFVLHKGNPRLLIRQEIIPGFLKQTIRLLTTEEVVKTTEDITAHQIIRIREDILLDLFCTTLLRQTAV